MCSPADDTAQPRFVHFTGHDDKPPTLRSRSSRDRLLRLSSVSTNKIRDNNRRNKWRECSNTAGAPVALDAAGTTSGRGGRGGTRARRRSRAAARWAPPAAWGRRGRGRRAAAPPRRRRCPGPARPSSLRRGQHYISAFVYVRMRCRQRSTCRYRF